MEPSTIVLCSSLGCVPLVRPLRDRLVGTGSAGTNKARKHSGGPKLSLEPTPRRASGSQASRSGVVAESDARTDKILYAAMAVAVALTALAVQLTGKGF